jgi:hypothetical protein
LYNTHQQVDFTATSSLFNFQNINQLKINIYQNNFEINYKNDIKPTFIENQKLIFSTQVIWFLKLEMSLDTLMFKMLEYKTKKFLK